MTEAMILFAHGAREAAWAEPVRRVQTAIREGNAAARIEIAFLEFLAPTLADCVAALAADGVRRIVILPMFIAQGGHLKREVPEMVATLRATYPGIDIELARPVGEAEGVIQAMATAACQLLGQSH